MKIWHFINEPFQIAGECRFWYLSYLFSFLLFKSLSFGLQISIMVKLPTIFLVIMVLMGSGAVEYSTHGLRCASPCASLGYSYTWCKVLPGYGSAWKDADYCSLRPNTTSQVNSCEGISQIDQLLVYLLSHFLLSNRTVYEVKNGIRLVQACPSHLLSSKLGLLCGDALLFGKVWVDSNVL